MGWREIGKLAKNWLENEKTELLTTDHARREMATTSRMNAERDLKDAVGSEIGYQVLERTLRPDLAARVTAARPENVRARHEQERLDRLAAQPTALLQLTMSGELQGSVTTRLPLALTQPDEDDDDPMLTVDLEAPAPIPAGSDTFAQLTITVPYYRGPGRYDLTRLWQRVEAGEIAEFDVMGIAMRVRDESTDLDPMWDSSSGIGLIEVGENGLTFDLGMGSAAGWSRLTGSIDWSPQG
jgi:hypothetical protein